MTEKIHIKQLKSVMGQVMSLPTPTAELAGRGYQYMGVTTNTYEHGYIYECVETPVNTMTFAPDIMSCDWDSLVVFLQNQTPDYNDIVKGSMTYNYGGDLWRFVGLDENDNVVLSYQQYTPDWEDYGFSFYGTFADGETTSFVRTTSSVYVWQRMDVQPGGSRGRFLAIWNCATGLAESNPPISPYEYKTGDYFVVGTVSSATPAVNYKPDGTSYTTGVASTTVETNEVAVDDTYFFDGTSWKLQSNSNKTVTFSNIVGDIYDNASATTALNAKQNTITGAATTITTNNLTASKAVISNASGKIDVSATTATELGYLSGVTSAVQTQLNNKQATLVSGTNIKTINSGSILGSGNIDVLVNEATPASSLGVGYTTVNTTYTDSINIGNGAQIGANNAIALGAFASAEGQDSIAIYSSTGTAHRARTTHTGNIAIGYNALAINAAYTIAIGYNAYAQGANSIQLGTGQVALQNTFQVWTYPMLNKTSGLIPSARLADQTSATQGQALILDANLDGQWTTLATVATSGSYNDLLNKPTIPAAQVNADWNANSGVAEILNKPTIPTVNDGAITVTQNGISVGSFTMNQASSDTIALTDTTYSVMTGASAGDAGASGLVPAPAAGDQGKFLQGDGTWANPTAATAWGNITGTLADQTDLDNALKALVPVSTIFPFAGTTTPTGFLLCDGSAVSRTTYADLFAAIGTKYGVGDGSTTFNLPNFTDKAPWWTSAAEAGATGDGSLPNITGTFANSWATSWGVIEGLSGAFTSAAKPGHLPNITTGSSSSNPSSRAQFSAYNSCSTYSRLDNKVIPSYTKIGGWIIKY